MEGCKKLICAAITLFMAAAMSCSDDPEDQNNPTPPPPPPPGGSDVTITDVSGGHMFWGDEMVVTGTGFSTVKEENIVRLTGVFPSASFCNLNYTSASGGVIEIVSATATQLKIKIPVKLNVNGDPVCGPEEATVEVTVSDKKATKPGVKFNALPWIGDFNYHYGWFDYPSVTRIGDSVMIAGGMLGYRSRESELWDDITLHINGSQTAAKYRTIGLESGWAFYLPTKDYGEINCSEDPNGWAAREMRFTLSVAGKSVSNDLFVQYLPEQSASCQDCPTTESALNPVDPKWIITGTNMYYSELRFVPTQPCGGSSQGVTLNKETFDDEITVQIPLSILEPGCSYNVFLVDPCQNSNLIGFFARGA
ncbi:MAG TPA: hypothetical protein VIU12_26955 [Chryseolinea sp.]